MRAEVRGKKRDRKVLCCSPAAAAAVAVAVAVAATAPVAPVAAPAVVAAARRSLHAGR